MNIVTEMLVGDVCYLNGTGPDMAPTLVIEAISPTGARVDCVWFDCDGRVQRGGFLAATIYVVPEESATVTPLRVVDMPGNPPTPVA